jgi:hypothetical protein
MHLPLPYHRHTLLHILLKVPRERPEDYVFPCMIIGPHKQPLDPVDEQEEAHLNEPDRREEVQMCTTGALLGHPPLVRWVRQNEAKSGR